MMAFAILQTKIVLYGVFIHEYVMVVHMYFSVFLNLRILVDVTFSLDCFYLWRGKNILKATKFILKDSFGHSLRIAPYSRLCHWVKLFCLDKMLVILLYLMLNV